MDGSNGGMRWEVGSGARSTCSLVCKQLLLHSRLTRPPPWWPPPPQPQPPPPPPSPPPPRPGGRGRSPRRSRAGACRPPRLRGTCPCTPRSRPWIDKNGEKHGELRGLCERGGPRAGGGRDRAGGREAPCAWGEGVGALTWRGRGRSLPHLLSLLPSRHARRGSLSTPLDPQTQHMRMCAAPERERASPALRRTVPPCPSPLAQLTERPRANIRPLSRPQAQSVRPPSPAPRPPGGGQRRGGRARRGGRPAGRAAGG